MVLIENLSEEDGATIIYFSIIDTESFDYKKMLYYMVSGYLGFDFTGSIPDLQSGTDYMLYMILTDNVVITSFLRKK